MRDAVAVCAFATSFALSLHPVAAAASAKASEIPVNDGLARTATGNYLAALHAERMKDIATAARYFAAADSLDPGNADLLARRFVVQLTQGNFGDAQSAAERLVKLDPDQSLANLTLAVAAVAAGEPKRAEGFLDRLVGAGLDKYVTPLLAAWVKAMRGQTDDAIATLEPLTHSRGFSMLGELHAAYILDIAGKTDAAEIHYKNAYAARSGTSLRLAEAVGSFYERIGAKDAARDVYNDYREENRDSVLAANLFHRGAVAVPALVATPRAGMAEALFNLASALHQEGAGAVGLIYARLALALEPNLLVARLLIADIYEAQGRVKDAYEAYAKIPRNSSYGALGRLRSAQDLDKMGRSGEAIERLRRMAGEQLDRPEALVALGDILRGAERFAEAVDAYDAAIERIGKLERHHWSLLYARGIALERSKQWRRAEADFQKALEFEPDDPFVLNYLAYSWIEQGVNLERAKAMVERAVQARPNDGFMIDSVGWVFYRLRDYPRAVRELERAIELVPHDPTINEHLGDAYWRVGRLYEARFQWERALAADPKSSEAPAIRAKLEKGLPALTTAKGPESDTAAGPSEAVGANPSEKHPPKINLEDATPGDAE